MFAARLLLIIGVFCISSVLCEKKLCNFEDSQCLTKAARRAFGEIIAGIPGVETSDPLYLEFIETSLNSLKYKVKDGYLSGMKKCKVQLMKISDNEQYDYHIRCPKLTLMSRYEMMAVDIAQFVKSSGTCKIDLYDYHFLFHGISDVNQGEMGKRHIKLLTNDLRLKYGNVTYNYRDLSNEGTDKATAFKLYAHNKWESVVKRTLNPVIQSFMKKHIKNKNAYLAIVPIQDLFYYEE